MELHLISLQYLRRWFVVQYFSEMEQTAGNGAWLTENFGWHWVPLDPHWIPEVLTKGPFCFLIQFPCFKLYGINCPWTTVGWGAETPAALFFPCPARTDPWKQSWIWCLLRHYEVSWVPTIPFKSFKTRKSLKKISVTATNRSTIFSSAIPIQKGTPLPFSHKLRTTAEDLGLVEPIRETGLVLPRHCCVLHILPLTAGHMARAPPHPPALSGRAIQREMKKWN